MNFTEIYKIDKNSTFPKYRQLVDIIIKGIELKIFHKGDKIPSLNEICKLNGISRDTVMAAFNELKTRGIIISRPGKGYFINNTQININQRIFVLFDEMNSFKEDMYNSFLKTLDPNTDVDIYFHHFNFQTFTDLIEKASGQYTAYVIMPATFQNTAGIIKKLPNDKVYILDRKKKEIENYPTIYQDFKNDVFEALKQHHDLIKKYDHLYMIHSNGKEPEERLKGLKMFADFSGIKSTVIESVNETSIQKSSCYLVASDRTLVELIKIAKAKKLKLGSDIGIISFNDTVLKEVVAGGISTISTDFTMMGKTLAHTIKNKAKVSVRNPWMFIERASV